MSFIENQSCSVSCILSLIKVILSFGYPLHQNIQREILYHSCITIHFFVIHLHTQIVSDTLVFYQNVAWNTGSFSVHVHNPVKLEVCEH